MTPQSGYLQYSTVYVCLLDEAKGRNLSILVLCISSCDHAILPTEPDLGSVARNLSQVTC